VVANVHIAVVGAGIVGAAIAFELARRGAAVTVIDAGGERASEKSFGWINASWSSRSDHFRLRHHAMGVWKRWERGVPGLAPRWTGGLFWELAGTELGTFVTGHAAMGYAVRMVSGAEVRRLEPALADPPRSAALAEGEGHVEGAAAARALRAAAAAAGARLIGARADQVGKGIVALGGGEIVVADRVVVTAGVGSAKLLGLPVRPEASLMVLTTPTRRPISRVLAAPGLLLRQDDERRVLCSGAAGVSRTGRAPEAVAQGLVDKARALLGEPGLMAERIVARNRPMPSDGRPIVGPMAEAGVYAAVMHSAVTLAPGVASLVADELLEDAESPLLMPFRPSRFS